MRVEVGNLEGVASLTEELGRGVEVMRASFERGEDLSPHVESLTSWLEDRAAEGLDRLEAVLEWADARFETELAGMTEGLRSLVAELFAAIRELVGKGVEFVKEHPDVFRALATLIAALVTPESGPALQPLLQQASATLSSST